jgi:phage terminase Nu1 subunit (DNA packaging protein)
MPQALRAGRTAAKTPTKATTSGHPARATRTRRIVNKTACCRHFGWSRAEFDKKAAEGMPVVEAAGHKGGEWRVDLDAVTHWDRKVKAEKAERDRLYWARQRERSKEVERIASEMSPEMRRLRLPRWAL